MISVFDLFKIGIGPSSSHTVGPMKAALAFREALRAAGHATRTRRVEVRLLGSLAWTGRGHATDKAVILGLLGLSPETIDPDTADERVRTMAAARELPFPDGPIPFDPAEDVVFDFDEIPPDHPNTMAFSALDGEGGVLLRQTWHSVGGGFVVLAGAEVPRPGMTPPLPFDYRTASDLVALGQRHGLSIAQLVLENEKALRPEPKVLAGLDRIAAVMFDCIERGMRAEGVLPGGLNVERRARALHERLRGARERNLRSPFEAMDHVNVYAIAVNEENAAGGRVVTAPTNGAAGVVPAVLRYLRDHCPGCDDAHALRTFLLTAGAIGGLFKTNASISGAEVGCQGEVGVACSMAAAGLAAALGGTNEQIENAAEIGMEHHLGMTCDPIGGLVQIPCIERNAFGAVKAINAASLALSGDGRHRVTLDQVIATMRETGADMQAKYKETSRGGLAVNVPQC